MDYASLDLLLAIVHHLLIFTLFGLLVAEFILIRPGLAASDVTRVSLIDGSFGLSAALILMVGFARANYAAKGWEYYAHNHFFWAKIGVFALIGLISLAPTIKILGWRKAARAGAAPRAGDIALARKCVIAELALFPFLPAFAAAMARFS